jgi:TrkA domain protein
MVDVRETKLPGVGVRHEFTTDGGNQVGVLVHHDGRREILVYDSEDPDVCTTLVNLTANDTRTMSAAGDRGVGDRVDPARRCLAGDRDHDR